MGTYFRVPKISFYYEGGKLNARIMQDGVALIPLSMYFKDSRAKVELGLCKGKKLYDKRNDDAKREAMRDIERTMKERN